MTRGKKVSPILNQKPFRIIADLVEAGLFADFKQELDFDTVAKVTRRYAYTVRIVV
jgi:hypothetical protein